MGWDGEARPHGPPAGLTQGDTPSLAWSVISSGTEKFNDYKGEFNYMLSLTSSGSNGTITHVFISKILAYIMDRKQNVKISVVAENIKWGHVAKRAGSQGVGEESHGVPLPSRIQLFPPTTTTWQPSQECAPRTPSKSQSPVACQHCSLTKGTLTLETHHLSEAL